MKSSNFGQDEDQGTEKIKRAKLTASVLNWGGILVFALILLIPNPYEYAIWVSIMLPLISIFAVFFFRGLIRIDGKKGSVYPSVFFGILMSSCGLVVRALLDFHILDHSHIWIPCSLIAFGFVFLILLTTSELRYEEVHEYFTLFPLIIFFFGYGYGTIVTANCYLDQSAPTSFDAKILDKRISSGKRTAYYLELTPWGDQTQSEEVSVSKNFYNQMEKGNSVHVYLKKGNFGIPWFTVTE